MMSKGLLTATAILIGTMTTAASAGSIPPGAILTAPKAAVAGDAAIAPKGVMPKLRKAPGELADPVSPFAQTVGTPKVSPGNAGSGKTLRPVKRSIVAKKDDLAGTLNYGSGNLNSFFHYSDRLVDTELMDDTPYRPTGWLTFTGADGGSYRCTASLISKSIIVTAGHCLHQGGDKTGRGRAQGWVRNASFTPAFTDGTAPFGTVAVDSVNVTSGWYNTGALDQGYDVGIAVLAKRTSPSPAVEMGTVTGWYGFCYQACLQPYFSLTQLGYPGNYASGRVMAEGSHLSVSDSRDFIFGSGMQGGSSGGPHVANSGDLSDAATDLGQYAARNVLFAVTSWGYVSQSVKIQGASSLSGPKDANNFKALFNQACTRARVLHGTATCTLL